MGMRIKEAIKDSIDLKMQILSDQALLDTIARVADICVRAFRDDKKILFLWKWRKRCRCTTPGGRAVRKVLL